MITEIESLATRSTRHAALGEPLRLRITDLLALGDAAPSELQQALGVPSNLLAHHLGVLEQAGLIERSRSEGDRRRSYLRLIEEAMPRLAPTTRLIAPRVLFVCTANSARSQLATALWRRSSAVPAASAGTAPAPAIAPGALAAAERHGLDLGAQPPVSIETQLHAGDFVVSVCDAAHEQLGEQVQAHWSIPDPVPLGTEAAFDAAVRRIAGRVAQLVDRVQAA